MDLTLFTLESGATWLALPTHHGDTVGIAVIDLGPLRHLKPAILVEACLGLGRNWAAVVHVEPPLRNIEMMGPKISLLATRIIPEKTKKVMHTLLVVSALGCRP